MGLAVKGSRQRGRISAVGPYVAERIKVLKYIVNDKLKEEIKKEEW